MTLGEQFKGARAALGGDGDVRDVAGHSRDLAEALGAQAAKDIGGDFEAELHALAELKDRDGSGEIEDLERQVFKDGLAHVDVVEGLGSAGGAAEEIGLIEILHHGEFRYQS